jgi:two-component system, NtrC family, response regulator AtoC
VGEERDNRTTVEREVVRPADLRALRKPQATVVIYAHDDTRVIELSDGETFMVGRTSPADVIVEDLTISRKHARFTFRDGLVLIEDQGSRNGTLVRGVKVENARVRTGEDVRLGGVAVSVHLREGAEAPLGISGYDQLVARLEDEVTRARSFGQGFSVVALFAPDAGVRRGADALAEARHVSRWAPRVREELRAEDALAVHGPFSVLALMPDVGGATAERMAKKLVCLPGIASLCCGIASFPESAKSASALVSAAQTAARSATLRNPVQQARPATAGEEEAPIVQAEAMRRLFSLADRVAGNDAPVLILGETGTGKEVIARHLHRVSPRAHKKMVVINCAALPVTLIESALFGHEKGAFTGADSVKKGVFEEADGSTVFLDEVGELSPTAQAALLRVLETRRFSRVGSAREIEVDTRIIAATHRDVEGMVDAHTFRADLYYRLNTMTLKVPPLRARREEIAPLAHGFLQQTLERWSTTAREFDDETSRLLLAYDWPGNVRELRNVIERAAVICTGEMLMPEDLPERVRSSTQKRDSGGFGGRSTAVDSGSSAPDYEPVDAAGGAFRDRVQAYEVKLITDALEVARGNQSRAAELLQMPLRTLVHKIKVFGLKKTYRRDDE